MSARQTVSKLHKYIGLTLAFFLIIIGATGSVIAFYDDLENAFNARMRVVEPEARGWTLRDALVIREKLEAEDPHSHVFSLQFPQQPDQSLFSRVMPAIDTTTGEPYPIDYDEVFANPYTGERLGQRIIGTPTLKSEGFFSFLYYLHYALIFPLGLGILLIGVLGLIWALECLLGFYLTLPPKAKKNNNRKTKPFIKRWWPAWKISRGANTNRQLLDLHRSSGLWLFPLLLIFSVTGFALNLGGPYADFIRIFTDYEHFQESPPRPPLAQPLLNPPIDWFKAAELGQRYFEQQAQAEDFTLGKPAAIEYRRDLGMYFFSMHTSRDLLDAQGNPTETNSPATAATIAIDATDGQFLGLQLPTGQRAGNTVTSWLIALHVTAIGGRPWQIAVSLIGLVVVLISITGVLFWWRKPKPKAKAKARPSKARNLRTPNENAVTEQNT